MISEDNDLLVDARNLTKHYSMSDDRVEALRDVTLQVRRGEFVAVMGPSGSGKSTLLNIIGCLERPTAGSYFFSGRDIFSLSDSELSLLRAHHIGFIFQTYNLIHQLSVLENVEVPFYYRGTAAGARQAALTAIGEVGLAGRLNHRPAELSGGEQQRTAIARCLAGRPLLILADEPTGNLDSATGRNIMELLQALHRTGSAILLVTHDDSVASYAGRRLHLLDGKLKNPVHANNEIKTTKNTKDTRNS